MTTALYSEYKEYTVQEGDNWSNLASRFLGNCFSYKYLVMANPHVPISPIIQAGTKLVIPVLSDTVTASENLPPWKRALAG